MRGTILAIAAILAAAAAWPGAGRAVFLTRLLLPAEARGFGGLSGIEVDAAGRRFVALSDRGGLLSGRFRREGGRLRGIAETELRRLPGRPDSEGLARAPDGRLFVVTEGPARALRVTLAGAEALPSVAAWRRLDRNAALEALAIDPSGQLVTLPEGPRLAGGPFPVWRLEGGRWRHVRDLPRRGLFLPVGADFGPDGWLYVLERAFFGPFGFRSRIRRLNLDGDEGAIETVLTTPLGRFGNLEGIALWRDGAGAIRLLTVADDDFSPRRRPAFVEFRLPALAGAAPER